MDKETKIDMLLSLLAKVMYQDSFPAASSDPTVVSSRLQKSSLLKVAVVFRSTSITILFLCTT